MTLTLDYDKYVSKAVEAVSEGIVMLKNEHNVLPLKKEDNIALFGRMQLNYYKSGTGSGGMVNVTKVVGILDGIIEAGGKVNKELLDVYQKWDSENPFDVGSGWGQEPWSQKEMPLSDDLVEKVSKNSNAAMVVIGRTAGEEQDNKLIEGAYLLSTEEIRMLKMVRKHFEKMVVLLNVGNIIDMEELENISPDSILYVWQGGMTGGTGTAKIIFGDESPSGKLTDSIAYKVSDYPSDSNFGDSVRDIYREDIYVGYRYFETFAMDKIRYPFGYGLSYTSFDVQVKDARETDEKIEFNINIKNTGEMSGKEVVQIYVGKPQGKLGNPARELVAFLKTKKLKPNETENINISVSKVNLASFDDSGVTGYAHSFVMEAGDYEFYVGTNVREAKSSFIMKNDMTRLVSTHRQALAPVEKFERIKPEKTDKCYNVIWENVPLSKVDESARREENLPMEMSYTGDMGIKLVNVLDGQNSISEFVAQLSDEDLAAIVRGEGMNCPKVTAGTASGFGGVSVHLETMGVPAGCCSDGPSGLRLDCGTKAFSLPIGTMLAATFNETLVEELYTYTGLEMRANQVDCLLGPGMNIHRHPLNGRNFEYFSEDPFVTGKIASAILKGLKSQGVTGTIKHFCGNNQETYRHSVDSVVSERALREIYLKGFEMAVKEGKANSIMTTYGSVNGLWTASSFDLTTEILRNDWGFKGIVMTDWWANINERNKPVDKKNFAAMVRAQNDLYMVCADSEKNDDNILESITKGTLLRSELQRCAINICEFLLDTHAMKRIVGRDEKVEIINQPEDPGNVDSTSVKTYFLSNRLTVDTENMCPKKGTNYSFALEVERPGVYEVTLTANSNQSELAQIPVSVFSLGTAYGTFTWNGTGGKSVSYKVNIPFFSKHTIMRLYFGQSGLNMDNIVFNFLTDDLGSVGID